MDFAFTSDQELLRRSVREFAEAELRPHVREWDDAQQFPRELLPKLAGLGLMGIQFPDEFGGAAMSSVDYCICIEELARVDPSVALSVAAHNGLGPAHIAMFGTVDQKRTYLTPLARGDKLGAWGLTEASAGSDAGTRQFSKMTSLVSLARIPNLSSFLPARNPSVPRSTMNAVMPRLPFDRLVTAIATIRSPVRP